MKTPILFLEDEPQMGRETREYLVAQGYTLVSPASVEDVFREINVNGAELLIYVSHSTKTHLKMVEEVFRQYPFFPSIHVLFDQNREKMLTKVKGPFHQRIRPLPSKKDFLKRVRKLIFLGRLARQNAALARAVKLQNKIDHLFESLDFEELKQKSVEFFAHEFKAKNAYFLSAGGFGYYLNEMWKVSEARTGQTESLQIRHELVSAMPSSEEELSRLFERFSSQLPSGWELKHSPTYLKAENGSHQGLCVIPFVGNKSKKVIGHVIMVDPVLYGDQALQKALPHVVKVLGRHLDHAINYAHAKSLSYLDDLTDLYNQRYLKLVLDKEINRAARAKSTFSVLFMDIDHFKQVNDKKGHLTGSRVLIELSKILHHQLRATDYGFRYGGDEFILILVGSNSDDALTVAERIRKQVEQSVFDVEGVQIKVTLSIGIATYPDHANTKEEIIELADRAMYCGKNKSRNVVYVAS